MEVEYCPHCGASMKMYWHRLTPTLVKALVKMKNGVNHKGENKIHLVRDLEGGLMLTRNEWSNFTKLRFHGLVAKHKTAGMRDGGYWLITARGAEFLKGTLAIPKRVQTFRNKVTDHSPELVNYRDVMKSDPFVESRDDIEFDFATPN